MAEWDVFVLVCGAAIFVVGVLAVLLVMAGGAIDDNN